MDRTSATRLGTFERLFLLVPLAGGVVFGALPYLAIEPVSRALGYTGDDPYVYRIAGAATFGYAVALGAGLREGEWPPLRHVVLATYIFNAVAFLVSLVEFASGRLTLVAALILIAAAFIAWSTATILVGRRVTVGGARDVRGARDVAGWTLWVIGVATLAAFFFGVVGLVAPTFATAFGYTGTDVIVYRMSGAATLGYGAMGVAQLRSPRWNEFRLPTVMGFTFNALAALASLIEVTSGRLTLPVALIGPASLLFAILFVIEYRRRGR